MIIVIMDKHCLLLLLLSVILALGDICMVYARELQNINYIIKHGAIAREV